MNRIHPTAVIDQSVVLGAGNTIGPYAVILGNVQLGDDNWIGPHVAIGTPGEMRGGLHPATWADDADAATVTIGNRNVIREFTTIQSGLVNGTSIGDDCYIMTKSHIPHDGILEDLVTVSCSVMIGGHCHIQEGANLGLGAVIHQQLVIGKRAMIGMGSVVTKNIPPFAMAYGSPARIQGANIIGMERAGIAKELIEKIKVKIAEGDLEELRRLIPIEITNFVEAQKELSH
jgi:UDP-N-acetylglucosamine acyltransferase